MSKSYRASFYTLGCRLNQAETAIISKGFENKGYQIVAEDDVTDLAVINTCTVTENSDAKCRNAIRRIQRKNPLAYIAVVGCYSQMAADEIAAIDGVDMVVGNQNKMHLADLIDLPVKEEKTIIDVKKIEKTPFVIDTIGQSHIRTRANLKIQDGCDFMCTFCIIPFARGRSRPREWNNLVEEARQLAFSGFKEIIITGVNVGTFELNGKTIVDVVDMLNDFPQIRRIRISSIEPTTIPDGIIRRMADENHKLLPFLHIPLQSGSDEILKKMRRLYSTKDWADYIIEANNQIPGLCIGTDVMVGFPGETMEHFKETKKFLADLPLAYFHVFNYSERKGTPAVKMEKKVEFHERARRSDILREVSSRKRMDFYRQHLGSKKDVLFEERKSDGTFLGYTDNFIKIAVHSDEDISNGIFSVELKEIKDELVFGEIKGSDND